MINTRRGMIVAALKSYGEESAAEWARSAPRDALETTLTVASWILNYGPTQPGGASILIDKAIALAGVCMHEEHPRDLAKKRRDLRVWREIAAEDSPSANEVLQGLPSYDVVSEEARDFWAGKSS